ncbi:MAG TPA: hypothetical protein VGY66_14460 [Gemmataceae bacterium]|jgi:hypothetical protein|nr:hypothetical protein [Gemmataceae bacterium]
MPQIILDDEQAKLLASSLKPVEVRDRQGNLLGVIPPVWTEEEVADAKKRLASNEPRYTTAEVLEHLRSLDGK